MKSGRVYMGVGKIGDKVMIIGGYDGENVLSSTEIYC